MECRSPRWLVVLPLLALLACAQQSNQPPSVYVTEYGLGPDKWATAWLLTRRIDPQAALSVADLGAPLPPGVAFDVPTSRLQRRGNQAAFEITSEAYKVDEPVVRQLGSIIHEIEVDFWSGHQSPEADAVEEAFRMLQQRHGRDAVSADCYVAFFDGVYRALKMNAGAGRGLSSDALALDCNTLGGALAASDALVPEVSIPHLLSEMRAGKSVVFIDVREADEFDESHIPDALNVTLRDLDPGVVARVRDADYVVSYCVKDFRGFEMAKALKEAGVERSVILNPYGIKGWISLGLPTVGTKALSKDEAATRLEQCMASDEECVAGANQRSS